MLIEIFGSGCAKCQTLYRHAQAAAEASGGTHRIVKVEDYPTMAARGILSTPALALEGRVRFQGKVPPPEEILALLKA